MCDLLHLSPVEREKLDQLFAQAMIDERIHERLVRRRDVEFMAQSGLSTEVQSLLISIRAASLEDLARVITERTDYMHYQRVVWAG
jgi:hypothetical protein